MGPAAAAAHPFPRALRAAAGRRDSSTVVSGSALGASRAWERRAGRAPEAHLSLGCSGRQRLTVGAGAAGTGAPGAAPPRPPPALTVVLAVSPVMGHGRAVGPGRGVGADLSGGCSGACNVCPRVAPSPAFIRLPPTSCLGAARGRGPRVDLGDAGRR